MSTLPKLHVLITSTRPGRIGPTVAQWVYDRAVHEGTFEVELVDLAAFHLPVYDEPIHPVRQQYEHEHTRRWSASVNAADAYVFVLPEYNFSPPPSLTNALNYVYREWNYKPVAFVSYGGMSGGLRSVQATKLFITTFKMVPLVEAVAIPFVTQQINDTGVFTANEIQEQSAKTMLQELRRWTDALKPLRSPA